MRFAAKLALLGALAVASLLGGAAVSALALGVDPLAGSQNQNSAAVCPSVAELNAALAQSSAGLEQDQYGEVVKVLQPLAKLHCNARVELLLAAAYEGLGNLPAANQVLVEAHTTWPEDDAVSTSLARNLMQAGETQQAAETLKNFHPTAASSPAQLELSTLVFVASHQLTRGREAAEMAYQREPSLRTLLLLANALQVEGRYKDVLTLLEAQRSVYGKSAPFLITVAESEFDAKIFDRAEADLQQAVQIDPTRYQAHYLLGNVLFQNGDTERAIAQYKAALQLSSTQPRTWYQLALAYRSQGDVPHEQDALEHALGLDGHFALAHCELGRILLGQNKLQAAIDQLNAAVQDNPATEQAYYLLSKAYEREGDHTRSDTMAKRLSEVRSVNHQTTKDAAP